MTPMRAEPLRGKRARCPPVNPRRGDGRQRVEQELDGRGTDADAAHERRPGAAEDLDARDPHVTAERAGDQIDPVAEFTERLDAVVLPDRASRAARKNGSGASIRTRAEAVAFGNRAERRSARPGISVGILA